MLLILAPACGEDPDDRPGLSTGLTLTGNASASSGSSDSSNDSGTEAGTDTQDSSSTTNTSSSTTNTTSTTNTGPGDGDGDDPTDSGGDGDDPTTTGNPDPDPPPIDGGCAGYATRFWDCCKLHCGWQENVPEGASAVSSCNANNQSHGNNFDVPNSCQQQDPNAGYTCFNMAPWAVNNTLSYGFAAVPANGDVCGRCYQLEFTGPGHYDPDDPGSNALEGKTMIVQATNIGFDVGGGQFDIMIPGGGVGAFNACSYQWNVGNNELGATYGGFLTACQQQHGDNFQQIKQCVMQRCASVFDEPGHGDLVAGCDWFVNWFETADNPDLEYQEVPCPQALIDVSGIERPQDDIEACGGGGCTQEQMDMCDCSWTNNGQNCGQDDGSCCWQACCG